MKLMIWCSHCRISCSRTCHTCASRSRTSNSLASFFLPLSFAPLVLISLTLIVWIVFAGLSLDFVPFSVEDDQLVCIWSSAHLATSSISLKCASLLTCFRFSPLLNNELLRRNYPNWRKTRFPFHPCQYDAFKWRRDKGRLILARLGLSKL